MLNFLDSDSKFTAAIRRLMFYTLVNIFWLLCCIPVVTIGLSTMAMFSCLNAYAQTGDPDSWKKFFPALRENWKQGLLLWLLVLLAGAALALSAVSVSVTDIPGKPVFIGALVLAAVGFCSVAVYSFPLLAQFHNTIPEFIRISCIIGFRHIFSTILILLYGAVILVLCAMIPYLIPLWCFGGFAAAAGLINRLYHRIFLRYGAPEWEKPAKEKEADQQ